MKVRDLISILRGYDQDKDIWVLYDSFDLQEPDFEFSKQNNGYIHDTY